MRGFTRLILGLLLLSLVVVFVSYNSVTKRRMAPKVSRADSISEEVVNDMNKEMMIQ